MSEELGWRPPVGYLEPPLREYPSRSGKGIRPALLLASCEAFGGLIADGLPSAMAIEMLHNAFLIHDDIEDGGELRRGQPTLHEIYGLPMAVHAGDALALRAMGMLGRNQEVLGPRLTAEVYREFDFMARQTAEGQAIDLGWRQDNRLDLTPGDYLDLMMRKTSWYTTVMPLRVGALIGSRGGADLEPMIEFGFMLGAAFQIRDDLLNMTGATELYGKERFGDLREAKRTLAVIHLYAVADPDGKERIAALLSPQRERSADDVEELVDLLRRHGSVEFAAEFARGVAAAAAAAFDRAFASATGSGAVGFLRSMVPYMVERSA